MKLLTSKIPGTSFRQTFGALNATSQFDLTDLAVMLQRISNILKATRTVHKVMPHDKFINSFLPTVKKLRFWLFGYFQH
jgi:hypothetical protein